MKVKKVENVTEARICDELLTRLINEESELNDNVKKEFKVKSYMEHVYNKENTVAYIALEGEKVVGYIYIKIIVADDGPEIANEALIDGLYILEEYRRIGVASALIYEAKKYASSHSCKYISLNVLNNNEAAKSLYKKHGFKEHAITLKQEL